MSNRAFYLIMVKASCEYLIDLKVIDEQTNGEVPASDQLKEESDNNLPVVEFIEEVPQTQEDIRTTFSVCIKENNMEEDEANTFLFVENKLLQDDLIEFKNGTFKKKWVPMTPGHKKEKAFTFAFPILANSKDDSII